MGYQDQDSEIILVKVTSLSCLELSRINDGGPEDTKKRKP